MTQNILRLWSIVRRSTVPIIVLLVGGVGGYIWQVHADVAALNSSVGFYHKDAVRLEARVEALATSFDTIRNELLRLTALTAALEERSAKTNRRVDAITNLMTKNLTMYPRLEPMGKMDGFRDEVE